MLFSILWKGGKTLEVTWLLTGVAWLLTFLDFRARGISKSLPPMWIAVTGFLFVGWTVASFVLSTTGNYGFDEVLRDSSVLLIFFWILRRRGEEEQSFLAEKITSVLTLGVTLACVIGIFVYALQPVSRFVGTFFDMRFQTDYWPNSFAQFLLLAWPVALWRTRRSLPPLRAVLMGCIFGCLLLTYSRSAILVFALQAGAYLVLIVLPHVFAHGPHFPFLSTLSGFGTLLAVRLRKTFLPIALTLIVSLGLFFAVNQVRSLRYEVQSAADKITFTAAEGSSSADERWKFWQQSFALSLERPLFGWGPYSFRFVHPRMQTGVYETSDHPHNVFLKLAMERGWPAAVLFGVLVAGVIAGGIRRMVFGSRKMATDVTPLTTFLIVGLLGAILHNLIDYDLQFVGILLPFWVLLAMVSIQLQPLLERENLYKKIVLILQILLAGALMIAAVWEGVYLTYSTLGRRAEARQDYELALQWYANAKHQQFSRDMHLSTAQILLKLQKPDDAAKALERFLAKNTEDARAWKIAGDIAYARKDLDVALVSYERAFRSGKWNYLSILSALVKSLHKKGGVDAVGSRRAEIDEVLNAYADAISRNVHFIALSPSVEEFLSLSKTMSEFFPDEAARYEVLAAKVDRNATFERERTSARPPGMLW